jgi:hypothetical protein
MKKHKKEVNYEPQQIQLEIPDYYSLERYYNQKKDKEKENIETVIIIDIY